MALDILFPPTCVGCGCSSGQSHAVCGACWRDIPVITGPICDKCGVPILADRVASGQICEACLQMARPWSQGRSALLYKDKARSLVLSLKHRDRQDIAKTAAIWMARAALPLVQPDTVLVPVPLHWSRLVKRRYNQSALLAQQLALRLTKPCVNDGLCRTTRTVPLDGVSVPERFERLQNTITVNLKRAGQLSGRAVLLIDDVMTSGATLAACAEACHKAGARRVDVLVLARVTKDT